MNTQNLTTAIRSLIASHGDNKQQLHDLAKQGIMHSLEHGDSNALGVTKELIAIDHTGVLKNVIRMVDFDLPQKLGRKYALNKARNNQDEALKLWAQAFEEAGEKAFDLAGALAYRTDVASKISISTTKVAQLSEWMTLADNAPSVALEAVGNSIDNLHKQVTNWRADLAALIFLEFGSNEYPQMSEKGFLAFERALVRMTKKFGGKLPE
jgi:hypothetical protein